jgi:hypothetical protein
VRWLLRPALVDGTPQRRPRIPGLMRAA